MMILAFGALGVVALWWTSARPFRAGFVLLFVVATNASAVGVQEFGLPPLITPFAALIAIVSGIRWVHERDPIVRDRSYEALVRVAVAGIVVSAALGAFHAASPETTSDATFRLLELCMLMLAVAATCTSRDGIRGALSGLLGAGLWLGGLTMAQLLLDARDSEGFGFARWTEQTIAGTGDTLRAVGPFGEDPNAYAQYLVTIAGATLMIMAGRRWPLVVRGCAAGGVVLVAGSLAATASRTGLVAFAVVVVVVAVLIRPGPRVLGAVAALVVVVALFGNVDVGARLATLGEVSEVSETSDTVEDGSLRGRTSELIAAWRMFVDHPIAGVGYGGYNDRYLEYSREIGLDRRFEDRSAHSLPLEIAAEQGVIGLLAWGALFSLSGVGAWRLGRRTPMLGRPLFVAQVGFAATAVFLHDVHPGLLFAVTGMGLGAGALAGRSPVDRSRPEGLRVAMVIQNYLPSVGGAERQLASVTPLLIERGVTPIVVTRGRDGLPATDRIGGAEVIRVPVYGPKVVRSIGFVDGAVRTIRSLDVDAVVAYDSLTPSTIGRILRADGIPYATKILRSGELGDLQRLERKPFGRRRLRQLTASASAFLTISRDIDDELAVRGVDPSRRRFLPNGVDTRRFTPDPDARRAMRAELDLGDDPVVVMTGRVAPEKRVVEIARAWDGVRSRRPGARLVVVGDGPLLGELRGLPGVLALGRRDDVERILAASDVYLSASRAEGLSNALLEAMSAGLACVVTDVGGVRDVVIDDHTARVVAADDLDRLLDEVDAALADDRDRERMGARARARVEEAYALDATADRLVELCRDLADRPEPTRVPARSGRG